MSRPAITFTMLVISDIVLAQGITNPAGGGVIPVMFMIVVGLPLVIYVFSSLPAADDSESPRAPFVIVPLSILYLLLGIGAIYAADHHSAALYLYLEVLLLAVGTALLICRSTIARCLAVASIVLVTGVLNFFHPKLVDLQDRRYVNNENSFKQIDVTYPGHWREMHLSDGRVLLNINPQRRYAGSMQMNAATNRIKSPVMFDLTGTQVHPVIKDIYRPVISTGTWGWARRPEAFFELPLFGQVRIEKITPEPQGKALLLDDDMKVDCHYLFEARGEPIPDALHGENVVWSTAATVSGLSEVSCEEI